MPGVTDLALATNQGYRIDYISEKHDVHHRLGMRRAPIFGH